MTTKSKKLLGEFSTKVIAFIKKIPRGKVATYGQIARLAGKPHGARGVAWILHSSSTRHRLPWHRVLNSKGKISFHPSASNYALQKRRLVAEGVEFSVHDEIEMTKFQWTKKAKKTRSARSSRAHPKMFS